MHIYFCICYVCPIIHFLIAEFFRKTFFNVRGYLVILYMFAILYYFILIQNYKLDIYFIVLVLIFFLYFCLFFFNKLLFF